MDDDLKKAWQSQTSPQRLTLDAGLVLNEVRRNERQFAATIFCRDVREVGVALLLVPVWIYMGIKTSSCGRGIWPCRRCCGSPAS